MRSIHWFRNDLRLTDNPALIAASGNDVLPVYILDSEDLEDMGQASKLWLHHSLKIPDQSLEGKLHIIQGNSIDEIEKLIDSEQIDAIYWNRVFEPKKGSKDNDLIKSLEIDYHIFNGSLLWEPESILKDDGTPYRVFTPYYRKGCSKANPPRKPLSKPNTLNLIADNKHSVKLDKLGLLPKISWDKKIMRHWVCGESAAQNRLNDFVNEGLTGYKEGRNFPRKNNVSRLSPHLHFGEISPNQIWYAAKENNDCASNDKDHFMSELGWREFSHSLLYHFPELPYKNLQSKFDLFPWNHDEKKLEAWRHGKTGYPIVDAGMRELWQTGYVHNRIRMVVGSFLVKNLLIDWRYGERWFWDCLVDADLANNSASWQWVAGCGADAAPYFRIFNPITQGNKFDSTGTYTRRYVPELEKLPDKYLFSPWEAPDEVLSTANIELGVNYPQPIVAASDSREMALAAFASIKKENV